MTRRTRVLIVDDHPTLRRGLIALIQDEADLEVCGESAEAGEALRMVKELNPDVVVVDLSLKQGTGLELIEQVKALDKGVKMLVASMHEESLYAERALRAGAMGYINKQETIDKLVDAIRQILRGQIYLSEQMTERVLHRVSDGEKLEDDPINRLSNRELEVFQLIGQGLTTKQIAEKLSLSPKTVETHREKIKNKLNLKIGTEVNLHAIQWVLEHR
jgi:DNA-binding NarL/FixJ family response regulator